MKSFRLIALVALTGLAACSGGGGGVPAPPVAAPPGQTPQSAYVTPTFTFVIPAAAASTSSTTRSPDFVGTSAASVTITLVSSSAVPSLNGTAATTALNGTNCTTTASGRTCTVSGPPVPPGTDVFQVSTFDSGSNLLATSSSTATSPATGNPSFTITAGTNNPLAITLFGVPAKFTFGAIATTGTPGTALGAPIALTLQALDFAGDPITGTFASPVTLSDSDTSGAQGTQLNKTGGTAGTTQTFTAGDTSGNITGATLSYGGLAIASPKITISATSATSAQQTFTVGKATIVLNPTEVDLYTPGMTGSFAASETGWSNAPYSHTFTTAPGTCASGTAATVYGLTSTNSLTFTDTAPAAAAAGSCTVTVSGDLQGNTATETLTYTTAGFTVNGKARSTH